MRNIVPILALAALAGCGRGPRQEVDPRISDKSRPLVFLTYPTEPPCSYIDASGTIVGTDVDMARRIAEKMGRKIVVEGVAMVKKHQKPRGQGMPGGIVDKEAPIPASKVMLVCPSCKKATRLAHKFIEREGQKPEKVRVCKKCGAAIK